MAEVQAKAAMPMPANPSTVILKQCLKNCFEGFILFLAMVNYWMLGLNAEPAVVRPRVDKALAFNPVLRKSPV
jgi:hypothetical protein